MSDLIAAMSVVDVTDAPPIGEVRSQGRIKRSKAGRAGRPAGPGRSDDDTTALATTLRASHSRLSRTGAAMDAVLLRAGKPLTPEERNAVRDAEAGEMGGEYRASSRMGPYLQAAFAGPVPRRVHQNTSRNGGGRPSPSGRLLAWR